MDPRSGDVPPRAGFKYPLGHQTFANAAMKPVPRLTPLRRACRIRTAESSLGLLRDDAQIRQFCDFAPWVAGKEQDEH